MYNLQKAKQEIDAVATHTADLTAHVIAMDDRIQAKLDRIKADLLEVIASKFAELQTTILGGDHASFETSAVADLGTKIAALLHRSRVQEPAVHEPMPHEPVAHEPVQHEPVPHESAAHEGDSHPSHPSPAADVTHDDHGQHDHPDHHHD